jgi:hypothetical protein
VRTAAAEWNTPGLTDLLVVHFAAGQPELRGLEEAIRQAAAALAPPPAPVEVDNSAMRQIEITIAEAKAVIETCRSAELSALTFGPAQAAAAPGGALAQLERRRQASDEAVRMQRHLPELTRALNAAREEWRRRQDEAQAAVERQRRAELAAELRELDAKLGEAVGTLLPRILAIKTAMSQLAK